MADTPERRAARLAEILAREADIYSVIRQLAGGQDQAIATGDTSALMRILAEKQRCLAEIGALEEDASPLRVAWELESAELPEFARSPVEQAVETLRTLLAEIVALEDKSRNSYGGGDAGESESVKRLRSGVAARAYGANAPRPGGSATGGRQA